MLALAARNKNPGNIRPGQPWEGLASPSESGGFCVFNDAVFGFRAMFRNYIVKADRGINTIRALITEWAPPTDNNDTQAYIDAVCKRSGYKPDDVINLKSWDVGSAICYAQTIQENGRFDPDFTMAQMAEGALRAGIVDAPKSPIRKLGVVVTGSAAAAASVAPQILDAVNTYRPVIDQVPSQMLKTIFGFAAGLFALLAIYNHVKATK